MFSLFFQGTRFLQLDYFCTATVNAVLSSFCSIIKATQIVFEIPSNSISGNVLVEIMMNNGGTEARANSTVLVVSPTPSISQLNPSHAYWGSIILISGSDFPVPASDANCSITVGNVLTTCTLVSTTQLSITIGPEITENSHIVRVVFNGGGSGATAETSSALLTVVGAATYGSLLPVSGYSGSTITVIGSNFITSQTCTAKVGSPPSSGTAASTCSIPSATEVVVVIGAGTAIGSAGVEVTFSNPSSAKIQSPGTALTIFGYPTLSNTVMPSSAYRSSTVTLSGSNFISGGSQTCSALIGAAPASGSPAASCAIVSSTIVLVVVGTATSAGAAGVRVAMSNPVSAFVSTTGSALNVIESPTVSGVVPAAAYSLSTITLTGASFLMTSQGQACSASVSSTPASSCTVLSSSQAQVVVGSGTSAGAANVRVVFNGGGSGATAETSSALLTVVGAATYGSLLPVSGYSGSTITVIGSNFITSQTCTAKVGSPPSSGTAASTCSIPSATEVVVVIGAGTAIGSAGVEVTFSNPSSAKIQSPGTALTIFGYPTLSNTVMPSSAYRSSTVTLSGSNFISGGSQTCSALIGAAPASGSPAASCSISSSTEVIVVIGASTSIGSAGIQLTMSNPVSVVVATSTNAVTVVGAPTLSDSVTPSAGYIGSTITLQGTNFVTSQTCTAKIGSTPSSGASAFSCNLSSGTQVIVVIGSSTSIGSAGIQLTMSNPVSVVVATSTNAVTVVGAPTLSDSVTPSAGYIGSTITLQGTNFVTSQTCTAKIGSTPSSGASAFSCNLSSGTQVIVVIGSSTSIGSAGIQLTMSNPVSVVVATSTNAVTVVGAPTLSDSVTPSAGYIGSTITLQGTNFVTSQTCTAKIGSTPSSGASAFSCNLSSGTQVIVVIGSSTSIGSAGIQLTMSNPVSVVVATSTNAVTVVGAPTLSDSVTPSAGYIGSTITLQGTNFVTSQTCTAKIGSTPSSGASAFSCNLSSGTQVIVVIGSSTSIGSAGIQLTMSNPVSVVVATSTNAVTVVGAPTLSDSVTPSAGYIGSTITLQGTNFVTSQTCTAKIGSTPSSGASAFSCNLSSGTQVIVVIGSSTSIGSAGIQLTMSNPVSVVVATSTNAVTVVGAPTLSDSVTPSAGYIGSTITLQGTNFVTSQTCTAKIGSTPSSGASAFSCNLSSGTQVIVVIGASTSIGSAGIQLTMSNPVSVVVATSTNAVTVVGDMVISNVIVPSSAYRSSTVTLSGSNFISGGSQTCSALIGAAPASGSPAASCAIVSSTIVLVVVGTATSAGAAGVRVAMSNPVSAFVSTTGSALNVIESPTVSGVVPAAAYSLSTITLTGASFLMTSQGQACSASVSSTPASSCTVLSSSQAQVVVGSGTSAGAANVRVVFNGGGSGATAETSSALLTVVGAATYGSLLPVTGILGSTITVIGSNFITSQTCTAKVGSPPSSGTAASTCSIPSATEVVVVIGAGTAIGSAGVEVTFSNPSSVIISSSAAAIKIVNDAFVLSNILSSSFGYPTSVITLFGQHLNPSFGCLVWVGSFPASSCSILSSTEIRFIVDSGATPVSASISMSLCCAVNPAYTLHGSNAAILTASIPAGDAITGSSSGTSQLDTRFDFVAKCISQLPSGTPTDGVLFECGATGFGTWLGFRDSGAFLRFRSGAGGTPYGGGAAYTATDIALLDIPLATLVDGGFMDGLQHEILWEVRIGGSAITGPGRIRLFIDGFMIGEAYTYNQNDNNAISWSGGNACTFATTSTSGVPSGEPSIGWAYAINGNMEYYQNKQVSFDYKRKTNSTFSIVASPSISGVLPAAAYSLSTITLTGASFLMTSQGQACSASVSSTPASSCTVLSSSQAQVVVGSGTSAGAANVRVVFNGGGSGATAETSSALLTVVGAATYGSLLPVSGYSGSTITVIGSNFITSQTCTAKVGSPPSSGTAASTCSIPSATEVVVVIGAGTAIGSAGVEVTFSNPSSAKIQSPGTALTIFGYPTLSNTVMPSSAYRSSTVTLSGSNFISGGSQTCSALIGAAPASGSPAASCSISSSTEVIVVIGASTSIGSAGIQLTMSNPVSVVVATSTNAVTVVGDMVISNVIVPSSAYRSSTVTLSGSNFISGGSQTCSALIGAAPASGSPAASCAIVSSTIVLVVVGTATSAGAAGVRVAMSNPVSAFVSTTGSALNVSESPTVSGVVPAAAYSLSTITLTGASFLMTSQGQACSASVSSTPASSCTVLSSSQAQVVVGSGTSAGAANVRVVFNGGGSGATAETSSALLTVVGAATYGSLLPVSGYSGSTITVIGSNFITSQTCTAKVGSPPSSGTAASTCSIPSATEVVVVIGAGTAIGSAGVEVTFSNPSSAKIQSPGTALTIFGYPTLSNTVMPSSAYRSSTVTLSGSNFISGGSQTCSALIGAAPASGSPAASCAIVSSTIVLVVVGTATSAGAAGVRVAMSNPVSAFVSTTGSALNVSESPTVSGVVPAAAYSLSTITLTGASFLMTSQGQACSASVSSTPASSCTVLSSSQAQVVVGSGTSAGAANVRVVFNGGGSGATAETSSALLTVVGAATYGSLLPVSGYSGSTITVIGSNFITSQTCTAKVGSPPSSGTAASTCSIPSATEVVVVIGAGTAIGSAGVEVTFSNPSSAKIQSPGTALTIFGYPTLSNTVMPSSAYRSSTVTLSGSNLASPQSCSAIFIYSSGISESSLFCFVSSRHNVVLVLGATALYGGANISVTMSNPPNIYMVNSSGLSIFDVPSISFVNPRLNVRGGSEISVSGNNFLIPCLLVFESYSKHEVFQSAISSNCSLSSCIFIAPFSSSNNSFRIYVQCSSGSGNFACRSAVFGSEFTFLPRLAIERLIPTSGFAGSTITVFGNAFADEYLVELSLIGTSSVVNATVTGFNQMTFVIPTSISSLFSAGRSYDMIISNFFYGSGTGNNRNLLSLMHQTVPFNNYLDSHICSSFTVQSNSIVFGIDPSVAYFMFPSVVTLSGTNFISSSNCRASVNNISASQNSTSCKAVSFQSVVVAFDTKLAVFGFANLSVEFSNPPQKLSFPILISAIIPKLDAISSSYDAKFGSVVSVTGTDLLTTRSCSVSSFSSFGWVNISSECTVHSSSQLSFRLSFLSSESFSVVNVLRVTFSNTGYPGMSIELSSLPRHPCASSHCTFISPDFNVLRIIGDSNNFSAILPPFLMTSGAQSLFKIYSIDEFRMRHTSGGHLFYVMPSGLPVSFNSTFATDNLDGTYNAAVVPNHVGPCKIDILRLTAGNILAEFFDGDPSLAASLKLSSEMHGSINFESQLKDISYSAIRWSGYLRPNMNILYTLHVYATGGVRIWIDYNLVLNRTDIPSNNGSTVLVYLSSVRAHHFIFDYMRRKTLASVQLKWSNNAEPLSIIPSKHFLHGVHHAGSPLLVPIVAGPVSSFSALSGALTLLTAGNVLHLTLIYSIHSCLYRITVRLASEFARRFRKCSILPRRFQNSFTLTRVVAENSFCIR
jgi:hypothetical protein